MVLIGGYVDVRKCGTVTRLGALEAPCSLLVGHLGRHYWAVEFPDLHIAIGWETQARDPAPDKRDVEDGDAPLRVRPVSVGTHKQGAGS